MADVGALTQQMKVLVKIQREMLGIMKAGTQVINAQEQALSNLSDTAREAEDTVKGFWRRTEAWWKDSSKFIHRFGFTFIPFWFKMKNAISITASTMAGFFEKLKKGKSEGGKGFLAILGEDYRKALELIEGGREGIRSRISGIGSKIKAPVNYLKKMWKMENKREKVWDFLKKKGIGVLKSLGAMLLVVGKYAILMFLAITGIWLLWKASGLTWKKIKEIGATMWEAMKFFGGMIWDGLQKVWQGAKLIFGAFFGKGTLKEQFFELWEGVFLVLGGLLEVLFGVLGATLGTLLVGIGGILMAMKDNVMSKLAKYSEGIYNGVIKLAYVVGAILLTIVVVIAGIYSIPALIITGIAGLIAVITASVLKAINPFAAGGVTGHGMSLVGEKGPELVRLPVGSRVYSNKDSKKMATGGMTNNITVNVQGRVGSSDSELRMIAQKVGQMINKEINRTTSSRGTSI